MRRTVRTRYSSSSGSNNGRLAYSRVSTWSTWCKPFSVHHHLHHMLSSLVRASPATSVSSMTAIRTFATKSTNTNNNSAGNDTHNTHNTNTNIATSHNSTNSSNDSHNDDDGNGNGNGVIHRVSGMADILSSTIGRYQLIENAARRICDASLITEIRTPIVERQSVFNRGLGDTSDVVTKEMFTFDDLNDTVVLRPEGTAGVVRALIESSEPNAHRLFYCGPIFRKETPQRGRYRQFTQFGVELIGYDHVHADVECIAIAAQFLKDIHVTPYTNLQINSLGDSVSRDRYRSALYDYFSKRQPFLSSLSQHRLSGNGVFRILDSKEADDIALVTVTLTPNRRDALVRHLRDQGDSNASEAAMAAAPIYSNYLNDVSQRRFDNVCRGLTNIGVNYTINPYLIRGLDYYCHTAFEFIDTTIHGRQSAVLAGGRYDGLMKLMGGKDTPAVGWAAGVDRLVLLHEAKSLPLPHQPPIIGVMVWRPKGSDAIDDISRFGLQLTLQLRRDGFNVMHSYDGGIQKQMESAAYTTECCIIIGPDEMLRGEVSVKNMRTRHQQSVALPLLTDYITKLLSIAATAGPLPLPPLPRSAIKQQHQR